MKKFLALLLMFTFAVAPVVGCGDKPAEKKDAATEKKDAAAEKKDAGSEKKDAEAPK